MLRHAHVFPEDMDRFDERQFTDLQKYVLECERRDQVGPVAPDG